MVQTCSCSLCTRTSAERCLGWLWWLRAGTVGCEGIASPAVASQMLPRVAAHAAAALDQLLRMLRLHSGGAWAVSAAGAAWLLRQPGDAEVKR